MCAFAFSMRTKMRWIRERSIHWQLNDSPVSFVQTSDSSRIRMLRRQNPMLQNYEERILAARQTMSYRKREESTVSRSLLSFSHCWMRKRKSGAAQTTCQRQKEVAIHFSNVKNSWLDVPHNYTLEVVDTCIPSHSTSMNRHTNRTTTRPSREFILHEIYGKLREYSRWKSFIRWELNM